MAIKNDITLVECPRDAMQGWIEYISVEEKTRYLNALLKVGFNTLDFGSFVSAKAIPQLRDTKEVLQRLDLSMSKTKLLAIVANVRGAEEAIGFGEISYFYFRRVSAEEYKFFNRRIAEARRGNSIVVCEQWEAIGSLYFHGIR
jgi:hydroxymethylglutaryl-CoA lyase